MRVHLPKAYKEVFCPACRARADHEDNTPTLINMRESEYLIECRCGGRYFCIWIDGVLENRYPDA